jgi:hypothetical protein
MEVTILETHIHGYFYITAIVNGKKEKFRKKMCKNTKWELWVEEYKNWVDSGLYIPSERLEEIYKQLSIEKLHYKVLICNHCKTIWISPKERCDECGSTTLTETHESNRILAKNYKK